VHFEESQSEESLGKAEITLSVTMNDAIAPRRDDRDDRHAIPRDVTCHGMVARHN
jgi:hypothetical protein